MTRLLWHRSCPLCGTPLTKEQATDQFRCTHCKWKEIWSKPTMSA